VIIIKIYKQPLIITLATYGTKMNNNHIYCTSYCNKGHRLLDGMPVNHMCHILPPKALQLEREEADSVLILEAMLEGMPFETSRGVKG
jgi:hypothetical protein